MNLLKTLALAIVLALVPTTAAFAGPSMGTTSARYGSGSFTTTNAQLLSSGCFYHPYSVNLNIGYETTDWYVDIRIIAPNGSVAELDFIDGTGVGAGSLAQEWFICSSLDAPGVYTITGTLETYEGTYDYTPTKQALAPFQFTVLPYVAPTPPPPPAPTTADVTGSVSSQKITRGLKVIFKSKALPAGTVVGKRLAWTVLVDGKIRKSFTQGPSAIRTLKFTSPARTGQHKVKVLRNGKALKTFFYRA